MEMIMKAIEAMEKAEQRKKDGTDGTPGDPPSKRRRSSSSYRNDSNLEASSADESKLCFASVKNLVSYKINWRSFTRELERRCYQIKIYEKEAELSKEQVDFTNFFLY